MDLTLETMTAATMMLVRWTALVRGLEKLAHACGFTQPRPHADPITTQGPIPAGAKIGPCVLTWELNAVAKEQPKVRKPATPRKKNYVMASVRLDVPTSARVAAAAALAGLSKTAFMERAITEALVGVVVFDRRKADDHVDLSTDSASAA